MLALLFGLIVAASLTTSGMIYFEVLEVSPGVLTVVGGLHAILGVLFFKAYADYRAVHRLVGQGRGELFSYVISVLIKRARTRAFADHYRLRHAQGAALSGQGQRALGAAESYRTLVQRGSSRDRLDLLAAEIAANLDLGQSWWATQRLQEARALAGDRGHVGLDTVAARLRWVEGDAQGAAEAFQALPREPAFPFGSVVDARRQVWLGDALRDAGMAMAARKAYAVAVRKAPSSFWGEQARRGQARLGMDGRG